LQNAPDELAEHAAISIIFYEAKMKRAAN